MQHFRLILRNLLFVLLPLILLAPASQAQISKRYDVTSYAATVHLIRSADSLFGVVTLTANTSDTLNAIVQDAKYISIDGVTVDDQPATIDWLDTASGEYVVHPATKIASDKTFRVTTYFHGHGQPEPLSPHWGGISDYDTMMFSMGVGFATPYTSCTRYWLPCYDKPDDKADSVDLTFITPDSELVASNGLLISSALSIDGRTTHWHISHPIASYLLTFATGPYTVAEIPNAVTRPIEVFALPSDSAKASLQMSERVARTLAFYDSLFAPYPFEKVGYVVTPIGSMEHQTMISLDKSAMDTSYTNTTPVHELAHMWWGDWVTCRTFDDAWLNEGFATFCESLVFERFYGRSEYLRAQHSNVAGAKLNPQYPLFGAPSATNHTNNYPTNTIYRKGAAVLGMLREYLGDPLFFSALRRYGTINSYSTATSDILEEDFEAATGQNLSWFFKEWVYGTGYPTFSATWRPIANGVSIDFSQSANAKAPAYYRVSLPVLGTTKSGNSKLVRVWMDSTSLSTGIADFGFTPDTIVIDPDGIIIKKLTRLSLASVETKTNSNFRIEAFPNPAHRGSLRISMSDDRNLGRIEASLFDSGGRMVRRFSWSSSATNLEETLNVLGLSAGSYILRVRTDRGDQSAISVTVEP